jgi:poly-gamma-glutamate capsule biosynthesis protein CapA/YwtB (metallophosphatase superfamily)
MATQDESTETDIGVGPQTPAARRRERHAPPTDTAAEADPVVDLDSGAERHPGPEHAAREDSGAPEPEHASAEERARRSAASAMERARQSSASAMERARRASAASSQLPPPSLPSARNRTRLGRAYSRQRARLHRAYRGERARLGDQSTREPTRPGAGSAPERAGLGPMSAGERPEVGDASTRLQARLAPATSRERVAALLPPATTRERVAALLALGSAVGVVLVLFASLGSSGSPAPGLADLDVTTARRVVAPGGWVALRGSGAPARARLILETRSEDGPWRVAASTLSDEHGDFRLEARALARPGPLDIRARVPGAGVSTPVAVTVRPLRLASVGDINLGDAPGDAIAANGPRYPWSGVSAPLRKADIAFGNLECAVSERGEPFPKEFNFRGTPDALAGLRRHSGIDVLNLANNHVGDYGPQAMLDTVRHVESLGMRAVGAGRNLRRALAPQVVERLGLRVAFVGFSQIAPLEFAAGERKPGTAWATPESVAEAVRAARRRADVVVATFHWGIEKAPFESTDQQALAQTAAAAGAHLVIGAHPHVLQPMRREGAALVAYSLGNFVFGAASSETTTTGILQTDLTADGVSTARWRRGRIVGARPVLDAAQPRRLPMNHSEAMAAGVSL